MEAAQDENLREGASDFFEAAHRALEEFSGMVRKDWKLRQVYIIQKLFEISRDLFKYAPPTDVEFQFLFVQGSLEDEFKRMSKADKQSFNSLQKEVLGLSGKDIRVRLSTTGFAAICYFSKITQDKQVLIIWNSEKLLDASVRLGTLLVIFLILSIGITAELFEASSGHSHGIAYNLNTLRMVGASFGGIVGGCISAIATSRTTSDGVVIPLINTDWIRPLLGAVAGFIFGLITTAGVGDVAPAFVMTGSISFGFSERVLYSWLKRRAEQLEKQLGNEVVPGGAKK